MRVNAVSGGIVFLAACAVMLGGCAIEPGKRDQPIAEVQTFPTPLAVPPLPLAEVAWLNVLRARLHSAGKLSADDGAEFDTLRRKYRLTGAAPGLTPEEERFRRTLNASLLSYYRDVESRAYPSEHAGPALCLALSGGGLRSASISMGVLAELADRGWLSRVDVYSSVSGGGYALGRLFVNASHAGRPVQEVARAPGFVSGVSPDIKPVWLSVLFALATKATGIQLLTSGVSVGQFNNGIDSTHEKTVYSVTVGRAFGYPSFSSRHALSEYVGSRREGVPVFNIAAFPVAPSFTRAEDDALLHTGFETYGLDETLFEFTPFRLGSPAAGYTQHWPTPLLDWNSVVAVSGAAPDSPFKKVSMPLRVQIGGLMHLVLPGLHIPLQNGPNEVSGHVQRFFATDGGFVDNTGIASLARRGCERIIALDATYDPAWTLESYGILKQRLEREHSMKLASRELDRYWTECTNKVERPDGVMTPADPPSCTRDGQTLREDNYSQRLAATGFEATIGDLPTFDKQGAPRDLRLKAVYLKAGLTPAARAVAAVSRWLARCPARAEACVFPMDRTETLTYCREQYEAYAELGRQLVRENTGKLEALMR